jgi:hypothetical protein
VAAPQTEQELLSALAEREAAMRRIATLQAEIAKGGFIPADQRRHNSMLTERVRLLSEQKRIEADIKRANPAAANAVRLGGLARDRLAEERAQRVATAERQRIEQMTRAMDLRQRYGLAGGAYARMEQMSQSRLGRAATGMGLAAGATVGGLARRGFGGTVEQNKFDYEMTLLSREVAAAFKPLMEVATAVVSRARRFMEKLGVDGQDAVMYGGMALGAYGTYRAARFAGGLVGLGGGGGLAGALAGGMMGGGGAAAAGGGGAMNMAALAATSAIPNAAAAPGRSALGRAVRSPLAKGLGVAAIAGGVYAATPSTPASSDEFRARHGANADELDKLQAEGGTEALLKKYQELKAKRTSGQKFYSAVGSMFGAAGQERDTLEETERRLIAKGVTPETGKRRSVTPAGVEYEEVGSAGRRAGISFLNQTAADDANSGAGAAEGTKAMLGVLQQIARNTEKKPEVK